MFPRNPFSSTRVIFIMPWSPDTTRNAFFWSDVNFSHISLPELPSFPWRLCHSMRPRIDMSGTYFARSSADMPLTSCSMRRAFFFSIAPRSWCVATMTWRSGNRSSSFAAHFRTGSGALHSRLTTANFSLPHSNRQTEFALPPETNSPAELVKPPNVAAYQSLPSKRETGKYLWNSDVSPSSVMSWFPGTTAYGSFPSRRDIAFDAKRHWKSLFTSTMSPVCETNRMFSFSALATSQSTMASNFSFRVGPTPGARPCFVWRPSPS